MSETPEPTENTPPPAVKRRGKLIPLLAVVLILGGGGGGAYWYFVARPAAAGGETAAPVVKEGTGIATFEPFVVNLADPGGTRYLRVNLSLVLRDERQAAEIAENLIVKGRIRSSLLELLAQQRSEALVTPDGKTALKAAIREHVAHAAHDLEVSDVLFSEFVVQF